MPAPLLDYQTSPLLGQITIAAPGGFQITRPAPLHAVHDPILAVRVLGHPQLDPLGNRHLAHMEDFGQPADTHAQLRGSFTVSSAHGLGAVYAHKNFHESRAPADPQH